MRRDLAAASDPSDVIVPTRDDGNLRKVLDCIERRQPDLIALLSALVRFPSETHPPHGDEGPVQEFIADVFRGLSLEVDIFEPSAVDGIEQHPGWWPGLVYEDRPNVVGVLRGNGGGRSLILNGHADVVPAGPRDNWTRDPYSGEVVDGVLFGRGAADQKAGIAAMTMAVSAILETGIVTRGDVILESVVNEELGGYNGTLACCVRGYEADAAIVTEPTGLAIVPAQKGGQAYIVHISGQAAHHGRWWEGVSALDNAVAFKRALRGWEELRSSAPAVTAWYSDRNRYGTPVLADTVWYLRAGQSDIMACPDEAELQFWVDVLPGEDRDEVLLAFEEYINATARLHPYLRAHPPKLERMHMRPFDPVSVEVDSPVVRNLEVAHRAVLDQQADILAGTGACDSMIFNLYSNTPAIVYGPGDIRVAHSPDEYVSLDQVVTATKVLATMIMTHCGWIEM
jgi:acetylornithine deacetylase